MKIALLQRFRFATAFACKQSLRRVAETGPFYRRALPRLPPFDRSAESPSTHTGVSRWPLKS
jgi:hypothetical protein